MWITSKEHMNDWGGKKEEHRAIKEKEKLIKLPFNYCNLSLTPFKDPYCAPDNGMVFDLVNIVPYIRKH